MRTVILLGPLVVLAVGQIISTSQPSAMTIETHAPPAEEWIIWAARPIEAGVNAWKIGPERWHCLDTNRDRVVNWIDARAIVAELDRLGAATWVVGDLDGDGDCDLDDFTIFAANYTGPN